MPVDSVPAPDLEFTVHGTPAQKGSKKGFVVGNRAIIVDDNKRPLRDWTRQVNDVVQGLAVGGLTLDEPLHLDVTFFMPRPKSLNKSAPPWHWRRPDLDKLVRALGDPLVSAGLVRDDSLFCDIVARKRYVSDVDGGGPKAEVRIWKMATLEPEAVVPKQEARSRARRAAIAAGAVGAPYSRNPRP